MHILIGATPQPEARVRLTYDTGETIEVDFTPYLERGGVFVLLRDPSFFAQVRIGEHGRFLQWPGELEFCADALFLKGRGLSWNNRHSDER
jgi:hypothetical protein